MTSIPREITVTEDVNIYVGNNGFLHNTKTQSNGKNQP